jgi:hypothetical protein
MKTIDCYKVPASLMKKAAQVSKEFTKLEQKFYEMNGIDLEEWRDIPHCEVLNGIEGVIGNAELIQDWIDYNS